MSYLPIIGLEIHVELRTKSKMFCGCPAHHFGQKPNTQTCPVCLGLPGALPVPNQQAVYWTMMIGKSLGCELATISKFDRKHYFYPDLPKGCQISQYDEPLCSKGKLDVLGRTISLTRVHLEEDTGKLQHQLLEGKAVTLVGFNRSGVPLVEIVSEPDPHSAQEAKAYAQTIKNIINFLGVSDCDMEKGSMWLEANISLSSDGFLPKYKVEVKNINSFRFLEKAIDFEINRQQKLLDQGIIPKQETMGFSEKTGATVSQRSKESSADYRYFPEPDIPPLHFSPAAIKKILTLMPLLPHDYEQIFLHQYHLRPDTAKNLITHRRLAQKALAVFKLGDDRGLDSQSLANLLINKKQLTESKSPQEIITHIQNKTKTENTAIDYQALVETVISANPDLVSKYHQGKTAILGVLIGLTIKSAPGQVNPVLVKSTLEAALEG